jgi:hypothetical protein
MSLICRTSEEEEKRRTRERRRRPSLYGFKTQALTCLQVEGQGFNLKTQAFHSCGFHDGAVVVYYCRT